MNEESKKLLTINTHKGLFKFNRLCPGVKPAAGIFQQMMETVFAGIEDLIIYFDDLLVATKTAEEHRRVLLQVFERRQQFNLRLRIEKCSFFQNEVRYLGVIVDARGQRPDPAKVAAIITMPSPTNIAQARAFLGAIGFYGRFIKSMSTIRGPIDRLMCKDVPFEWDQDCEQAFLKFKEILQSDLLLTHYDPQLPITVASDASSTGIGCVVYHTHPDGSIKAFYHASRRLSSAEQNYAQIEKEGLGIVFAVKKFHKYLWGRRFTILTDHQPLLAIFGSKKGIPVHTANRLQRWAVILLGYDFDIKYIRTTEFGHADILSRLIDEQPRGEEDVVIAQIIQRTGEPIVSNNLAGITFQFIRHGTLKDDTLQTVLNYVMNGWPRKEKIESQEAMKYFNIRDELSTIDDVLSYRDRTVIPTSCRQRVLSILHKAHPGIVRMKALSRCYVYWPGLDSDIQSVAATCAQCQQALKAPTKTCLSSWPTPLHAWYRVHIDFAGPMNGLWYFILVDAYSKYPEVFTMATTTTQVTVSKLREHISRFGNMEKLVSDNGPQFQSAEFAAFCGAEDIEHIRTAPYMPMSNGLAERFVDTFKRSMIKASKIDNTAIQEFLRIYRATPNGRAPFGLSPAELVFGRRMRIPISSVVPRPHQELARDKQMEEQFNGKHGAMARNFKQGEEVIYKKHQNSSWRNAKIIEAVGTVNYNILVDSRVVRAHTNQLRCNKVPETEHPTLPLDVLLDEPEKEPAPATGPRTRRNWRAVTRTSPPKLRPRH